MYYTMWMHMSLSLSIYIYVYQYMDVYDIHALNSMHKKNMRKANRYTARHAMICAASLSIAL